MYPVLTGRRKEGTFTESSTFSKGGLVLDITHCDVRRSLLSCFDPGKGAWVSGNRTVPRGELVLLYSQEAEGACVE